MVRYPMLTGRNARRGGQVLVIMLLAMTLLVGLIFYVYNVGDQVNQRTAAQNVADSVATAGGGWMARSMNVVAMNNTAQSRMLAMVPIMDAIPQAANIAYAEIGALADGLTAQINRGAPTTYLLNGLISLRDRMSGEATTLQEIRTQIGDAGSFDMAAQTYWKSGGSAPYGSLWQAAKMLEDFSEAVVDSAGVLAQADAARFGTANGADAAFIVPILPELPAELGTIQSFSPPLRGRLTVDDSSATYSAGSSSSGGRGGRGNRRNRQGGAIPNATYPYYLGPWAQLFKWRDYQHQNSGTFVETSSITVRNSTREVSGGGRTSGTSAVQTSSRTGYTTDASTEVYGYTTYGPYEWAWHRTGAGLNVLTFGENHLGDTSFNDLWVKIADIKLDYMFTTPTTLKTVNSPNWITDYPTAKEAAEAVTTQADGSTRRTNKVRQTLYYTYEIVSSAEISGDSLPASGTYRTNGDNPVATWVNRWEDLGAWPTRYPGVTKVGDYIWKEEFTYETTEDTAIGIKKTTDASGNVEYHTVYGVAYYIFGGANIGGDVDVPNPCNWTTGEEPPAPMLFRDEIREGYAVDPDYQDDGTTLSMRRQYFSYLGVMRKTTEAHVWPQQYDAGNPLGSIVTLAQVKVFNDKSWDLWTQDWQAQLTRIKEWNDWVDQLDLGVTDASLTGTVASGEVEKARDYMRNLEGLANDYVTH